MGRGSDHEPDGKMLVIGNEAECSSNRWARGNSERRLWRLSHVCWPELSSQAAYSSKKAQSKFGRTLLLGAKAHTLMKGLCQFGKQHGPTQFVHGPALALCLRASQCELLRVGQSDFTVTMRMDRSRVAPATALVTVTMTVAATEQG